MIVSSIVAAAAAIAAASTNEDKGLDLTPQKDDDPDGIKLLTGPEPLERAWKLLSPLLRLSISNIDVWIVVYDIAIRRGVLNGTAMLFYSELLYPGKFLQAVRALNHAKGIDSDHPDLHVRILHFRKLCLSSSHTSEPVLTAILR
jgi:peptide alpha-N-acetyltransferase